MGRVKKKKKKRWIRWGPNAKQREELEVRLLRSWWGIKVGLSSSRGSRERHGGQIPEIQKTARIETGKWLNEMGVGVREGSLLWPSSSLFEQTEMELTGTRNTRLYGVRELRPGWGGVTILALKQRMKWAPTLCPIPALRSLVTKIKTGNSYVYFDNLVWKKIIFLQNSPEWDRSSQAWKGPLVLWVTMTKTIFVLNLPFPSLTS